MTCLYPPLLSLHCLSDPQIPLQPPVRGWSSSRFLPVSRDFFPCHRCLKLPVKCPETVTTVINAVQIKLNSTPYYISKEIISTPKKTVVVTHIPYY